MVADIYCDPYIRNHTVYWNGEFQFETMYLVDAIRIAKLLGATFINVRQ